MINVVVISEDKTVQQRLAAQADIQLTIVQATSMDETVRTVQKYFPDIVVSEQNMENVDIDVLCHLLSRKCPSAQNIILVEDSPTFELLQNSGFKARGYLTPEQKHLIVKAVRVVNDGEAWLPRKLVADMLDCFASQHLNTAETKLQLIK